MNGKYAATVTCTCLLAASLATRVQAELATDVLTGSNMVRQTSTTGTNYFLSNVGIGTNAPKSKLHVLGNADIVGGLSVSGALVVARQGDVAMGSYTNGQPTGGIAGGLPPGTAGALMYYTGTQWAAMTNLFIDNATGKVFFNGSTNGAYAIAGGNIALNGKWLSNDGGNEGVAVANDGNVGVGTAAPATRLHVAGASGTALRLDGDSDGGWDNSKIEFYADGAARAIVTSEKVNHATKGNLYFSTADSDGYMNIQSVISDRGGFCVDYSYRGTDTEGIYWYTGNGISARSRYYYMDITSGVFRVVGVNTNDGTEIPMAQVSSTAGWSGYSTARVKNNVKPVDAATQADLRSDFDQLAVYTYERIDDPGRPEVGVIAETTSPWIKGTTVDTVNPLRWLGYLTAIVKDQQAQIDELKTQIETPKP